MTGRYGNLQTNKSWTQSLKDLQAEFDRWGIRDVILPTYDASRRAGAVVVKFAVKERWTELRCGRSTSGSPGTAGSRSTSWRPGAGAAYAGGSSPAPETSGAKLRNGRADLMGIGLSPENEGKACEVCGGPAVFESGTPTQRRPQRFLCRRHDTAWTDYFEAHRQEVNPRTRGWLERWDAAFDAFVVESRTGAHRGTDEAPG